MTLDELIRGAKVARPRLNVVEDDDAELLLRAVFKQLRDRIEATGEGRVKVAFLGRFHVKAGKRVTFRPAGQKE
jgi:hypothetical protein